MAINLDLGVRRLIPEWKKVFATDGLKSDLLAGLRVSGVAVPISMAVAVGSSVHPSLGLVSAAVGGFVCALWGGASLAVAGPAVAMAVLTGSIVEEQGLAALFAVVLLCGLIQLISGVLGLGHFFRYAPTPVVTGFTAGIAAILLIAQLPRALGLPPAPESHVVDVVIHLGDLLHGAKALPLVLCLITLGITFGLPRILPGLPAVLVAVVVPSGLVEWMGWDLPRIGDFAPFQPSLVWPSFAGLNWLPLVKTSVIVYGLASLESLLTLRSADRLTGKDRQDVDQEFVGQGLSNIAVSLFGGIPVTSVIARTSLSIQSGARTRRAAMTQSVIIGLVLIFLGRWLALIPEAVLTGVLLAIAIRMLHPREFLELFRESKPDAALYLATFMAIVFFDLLVGVQSGVLVAIAITAFRAWRARDSGGYSPWRAHSRLDAAPEPAVAAASRGRLFEGVERYRKELSSGYQGLFERLARGQSPHTLFITCSDSRISPNLITSTEPGELFVVRNVGNIVPAFGSHTPAEGAAIEYAIGVLGVKEIVICGHTRCGAMAEIVSGKIYLPENSRKFPSVAEWLKEGGDLRLVLPKDATPDQATEYNLKIQLERLRTYPIVQEALRQGTIRLHAWVFDILAGELREWSEADQAFIPVGARFEKTVNQRIRAGTQFQKP